MDTLPISVVVPHLDSRELFFRAYSLPSIEANRPAEIVVSDGIGNPAIRRNAGAKRATQEYLFFCDDDVVLSSGCLLELFTALEMNPSRAFAYCDFVGVTLPGMPAPKAGVVYEAKGKHFDRDELRKGNFISPMSLVRKSAFPGFDESLYKLEDWDLWLTIASAGKTGIYVPKTLFFAFYIDAGVTVREDDATWEATIRRKHQS